MIILNLLIVTLSLPKKIKEAIPSHDFLLSYVTFSPIPRTVKSVEQSYLHFVMQNCQGVNSLALHIQELKNSTTAYILSSCRNYLLLLVHPLKHLVASSTKPLVSIIIIILISLNLKWLIYVKLSYLWKCMSNHFQCPSICVHGYYTSNYCCIPIRFVKELTY